jgi:hypothetical protein
MSLDLSTVPGYVADFAGDNNLQYREGVTVEAVAQVTQDGESVDKIKLRNAEGKTCWFFSLTSKRDAYVVIVNAQGQVFVRTFHWNKAAGDATYGWKVESATAPSPKPASRAVAPKPAPKPSAAPRPPAARSPAPAATPAPPAPPAGDAIMRELASIRALLDQGIQAIRGDIARLVDLLPPPTLGSCATNLPNTSYAGQSLQTGVSKPQAAPKPAPKPVAKPAPKPAPKPVSANKNLTFWGKYIGEVDGKFRIEVALADGSVQSEDFILDHLLQCDIDNASTFQQVTTTGFAWVAHHLGEPAANPPDNETGAPGMDVMRVSNNPEGIANDLATRALAAVLAEYEGNARLQEVANAVPLQDLRDIVTLSEINLEQATLENVLKAATNMGDPTLPHRWADLLQERLATTSPGEFTIRDYGQLWVEWIGKGAH